MSSTDRHIKQEKLGRFGYIELSGNTEEREFLGQGKDGIPKAHEFHYFDSTCCGDGFPWRKSLCASRALGLYPRNGIPALSGFPASVLLQQSGTGGRIFVKACVDRRRNGKEKQMGVTKQ